MKIKKAVGIYVKVRAITQRQAVNLARRLFGAESNKLRAEANKLWAEANKLSAECNELWAKANKLRAGTAIKERACIPDYRALNLIAKDRDNSVYCFVWTRKEIWVYDGEHCPNATTVEKVEWENK